MIEDIHHLSFIKGSLLDEYLANGWYRMGRYIFTTSWLSPQDDDKTYPVYWLRYCVPSVELSASNQSIAYKCASFHVNYKPFQLTQELIELHQKYTASLKFETSKDLRTLLNDVNNEVYDSYIIEVRDGGKLIAAGIFDLGAETIAGIINIYDPQYRKYSLGKYLMLLKYQFCSEAGLPYYYPGYFSPEYPMFDYKLFLDKQATEVFIPFFNDWYPYSNFTSMMGE